MSGVKTNGMIASIHTGASLGPGLFAKVSPGKYLLANSDAPTGNRRNDEYWAHNSGITEIMTGDGTGIEDYRSEPLGDKVETASGENLPVSDYGRLRLILDQGTGNWKCETRELTLDRVAHVPRFGHHKPLSATRLSTVFNAPMQTFPAASVITPADGNASIVF